MTSAWSLFALLASVVLILVHGATLVYYVREKKEGRLWGNAILTAAVIIAAGGIQPAGVEVAVVGFWLLCLCAAGGYSKVKIQGEDLAETVKGALPTLLLILVLFVAFAWVKLRG